MDSAEYFGTLAATWRGQLVVCALGTNANEWWRHTCSEGTFYMHAAMGFASSFGLGLALSLPEQEVWVLDSDGGLCMNLGGLMTEATERPPNLKHFVLNNGCYQSLGGAPLVNAGQSDYAAIARGAGIGSIWTVRTAAELETAARSVTGIPQYAFVIADVERHSEGSMLETPPSLPYEGAEVKYRFGRYVERHAGIVVFGPSGY